MAALVLAASACYGDGDDPAAADTARYAATDTTAPTQPPPPATALRVVDGDTGKPVRRARGHFISFLFECELTSPLDADLAFKSGSPQNGQWAWHAAYPPAMIGSHEMYRAFIDPQP